MSRPNQTSTRCCRSFDRCTGNSLLQLPASCAATQAIVDRQLALWPEHESFLTKSFAERDAPAMQITEDTAAKIAVLAGERLGEYCAGYRWMCEAMLEEELFFRRHGRYRAQRFADVAEAIYDDPDTMRKYMNGLLLSQVFWRNHVDIAGFYRSFVSSLPNGFDHLEIGPGHGLQLAYAASDPKCHSATGWDISEASLEATRECLRRLDAPDSVRLERRDVLELAADSATYTSVVVSEVLEHLEDPAAALAGVRRILHERGLAFMNVPCNSPAPDHIHLFSEPEEFFAMVEQAGFTIVRRCATPVTGATLERARRQKLTISCAVIVSSGRR